MTEFISVTDHHIRLEDDKVTGTLKEDRDCVIFENQEDNHTGRGTSSAENKLEIENKDQLALTENNKDRTRTENESEPSMGEGVQKKCV